MVKNKLLYATIAAMLMGAVFTGCSNTDNNNTTTESQSIVSLEELASSADSDLSIELDDEDKVSSWDDSTASHITLGSQISSDSSSVEISGSTVTITKAGTYVISGNVTEGNIIVNTTDKETVRLILNNASISNTTTAPIKVLDAKKVILTLADNTTNTITDSSRLSTEEDYSAAIYSKEDLIINGNGTLNVNAGYRNGIKSTDDCIIVSGTLNITSTEDGIIGKDLCGIVAGDININAGSDGIKSTYDTDTTKGNVIIEGGNITIKASNDGIQAENILVINDGTINIKTNNGAADTTQTHIDNMDMGRGGFGFNNNKTTTTTDDTSESRKGIKAGNMLIINDGDITIDSDDDSVHCNSVIYIYGGTINAATGDDGVHADDLLTVNGGTINITQCYEGLEADDIVINDGDISVVSSDDGINSSDGSITINGGNLLINASGDGLDANGSIIINDGYIVVLGPTSDGDTAIDYDDSCTINGGTVMAFGSSGMLEIPKGASNGACIVTAFTSVSGGSKYTLSDSNGNEILSYTPSKAYAAAIVYSDKITTGNTYNITAGSTTLSIEVISDVTSNVSSGFGGAGGMNKHGNGGSGMPNNGSSDNGMGNGNSNGSMPDMSGNGAPDMNGNSSGDMPSMGGNSSNNGGNMPNMNNGSSNGSAPQMNNRM